MTYSDILIFLTQLEETLSPESTSVSPDEIDAARLRWARYCITHAAAIFLGGARPRSRFYSAIKALAEIETDEGSIWGLTLIASDPRFTDERAACRFAIQTIRWRASTRKMGVRLPLMRCTVHGEDLSLGFSHPALAQAWLTEWESDKQRSFVGTITLAPTPLRDDDL